MCFHLYLNFLCYRVHCVQRAMDQFCVHHTFGFALQPHKFDTFKQSIRGLVCRLLAMTKSPQEYVNGAETISAAIQQWRQFVQISRNILARKQYVRVRV
jgi:hypothetical protein